MIPLKQKQCGFIRFSEAEQVDGTILNQRGRIGDMRIKTIFINQNIYNIGAIVK